MTWMGSKTDIAAITALDVTDYQDGILFFALAEKVWLALTKTDTTSTVNSKSCFTATGGGRWFLSRDSTVIATTAPTGAAATGTRWVHQYNGAVNDYDSVITYYYNGTAWVETDARMRIHNDTPDSLSLTPNSDRETWRDTATGILYRPFSGGWVAGEGSS